MQTMKIMVLNVHIFILFSLPDMMVQVESECGNCSQTTFLEAEY